MYRLNYSIIGKMETYEDDFHHINSAANIELENKHANAQIKSTNTSNASTETLTYLYFRQMPRDLVESLYTAYKIDFDMFDYDPWKYIIDK